VADSPLEALQRRFVRSITFLTDAALVAGVSGGGKLTAEEAVDVYRGGYPARLTEALGETFEACWRVLGDEDFFAAAKDYIARVPSLTHNLADYGASFPEFLECRPDAETAPFIGDLARFEWAYKELFHAKAHEPLAPALLAAKARPEAVFKFGGAVRLMAVRYRVYGLWKRNRSNDAPLKKSDWEGAERLIFYKKEGNDVFVRSLSVPEYAALSALKAGRPLQEALASVDGLTADDVKDLFVFLSESGVVTEVR
jgi:hypothetical protein